MRNNKWNINNLRSEKEKLEKLLYNPDSLESNKSIQESISAYNYMLETIRINPDANDDIFSGEVMDMDDYLTDFFEEGLPCLNRDVVDILVNSVKAFRTSNIELIPMPYKHCILTNEELFIIAEDIFRIIGDRKLFNDFKTIANRKRSLIDIEYVSKRIEKEWAGASYFDVYNHIPYSKILRSNTIDDISTLVHELFHMIIRRHKLTNSSFHNSYIYHEVEGHFGSILTTEYLYNTIPNKKTIYHLNREDNNIYQLMNAYAVNASVTVATFDSMSELGNINYKDIRRRVNRNCILEKIKSHNIDGYITEDFEYESYVSFCYLIALDVFNMFSQDPEKSIYTLREITNLAGDNVKKELSKLGITFFEDGYQNLREKGKTLVKRNNILTNFK